MAAGEVLSFARTIRLDESVTRLAEILAHRYGVTVAELIEALLLGCAERDAVGMPSREAEPGTGPGVASGSRGPARVIELAQARRRPRRRAAR